MPRLDGFETCRRLKADPATRLIPFVLITGLSDMSDRIKGIEAGADDFVSKPVNAAELRARVRSLLRIKRYTDELDTAESVIVSLALTIEARDRYTDGHCQRLAAYAVGLGRRLGLDDDDLEQVRQAGFLHDIGKIAIAEHVLNKPAKLTAEEYEYVKTHALIGATLLESSAALRHLAPFVLYHHERWDGRGYPEGLAGASIPLEARILNVCDSVEAMASDRPYHVGMSPASIIAEIQRLMGTQFDPLIAKAFLSIVAREGGQFIANSALDVRQQSTEQLLMSPAAEGDDHTTLDLEVRSTTR